MEEIIENAAEDMTVEDFSVNAENVSAEENIDRNEENRRLRLELECAELGVKKECRGDVIRLAEGSSIAEVIKKYPVFLSARSVPDTGVIVRNESRNDDSALRKAFGLK